MGAYGYGVIVALSSALRIERQLDEVAAVTFEPQTGSVSPKSTHPLHGEPREPVRVPIVGQRWLEFTAVHWRCSPQLLQHRLPRGLTVDTFDGSAWISLTPFCMQAVRVGALPPLPLLTFVEVNLRTYAHDDAGRDGIWFLSVDVPRLALVALARATLALPYHWARTGLHRSGDTTHYKSRRRGSTEAHLELSLEVGGRRDQTTITALEHFLLARWRAFAASPAGLVYVPLTHPRWPLREAAATALSETVAAAAGLPSTSGELVVHYSDPIAVRLGPPRPTSLSRPPREE